MGATHADIDERSRHVMLQKTSVADIERAYTSGRIDYAQRMDLLYDKAMQVNIDAYGDAGYIHAIYRATLREIEKGVENLKEAATHEQGEGGSVPINIRNEAYYIGLAIWGQIQILNSIPTAFGEVTGLLAERLALQNGADPTSAAYIRIVTDVGSNFLPMAVSSKAVISGGQAVARGLGKTAEQVAAVAAAEKAAVKAASEAKAARAVVEEAIDVSMKKGGAEKTIFSKTEKVVEGTTPAPKPTVQAVEDFVKKDNIVVTPSGTRVNTTTGEVVESGVKVGDEFTASGMRVRVTSVKKAQDIASEKLGVPRDKVSEMLQGWAPESMAKGNVEEAAQTFVDDMAKMAPAATASNSAARLPKELAGAKPRYNLGSKGFVPEFDSDIDKALYIVAQTKLSTVDAKYMDWLRGVFPDRSDVAIRSMGQAVRRELKNLASTAEPGATIVMKSTERKTSAFREIVDHLNNEQGAMTVPSWGQAVELYRNLLLANPAARIRDVVSNIAFSGLYGAQRGVGGVISHPVGYFTGAAEGGITHSSNMYYAKGMAMAYHEALDAVAGTFERGGAGVAGTTRFDKPIVREIPGLLGDIVGAPTSAVVAIDRFPKVLHRRGMLWAQEMEDAQKTGRAFDINAVNLPTKERWDAAVQVADYVTFNNELGTVGKNLVKGLQYGVGEAYFTMMKTPINLLKAGWNNTPVLQLASLRLWNEIKAGGAAADAAMGRLFISNMFGLYVSELVKADLVTGSGPSDPKMRAEWLLTHQPYSWRVGDTWVSYSPLGGLAQSVSMIADYTQFMADIPAAGAAQISQAIMLSIERGMGENSWFGNLGQMMEAVRTLGTSDKAARNLADVASHPFTTFASGGQAGAVARKMISPENREARGIVDYWMNKQPGWSVSVPVDLDAYGDPVVPAMAALGRWAAPIDPTKVKERPKDRMRLEGERLRASTPTFGDSIGGSTHEYDLHAPQPGDKIAVGITPEQKHEWKSIYGNYLDDKELGMDTMMDTEEYRGAEDALKRQMFEGKLLNAKKFGQTAVMLKHPELKIKEIQNSAAEHLPKLEESERWAEQWNYKEAIDYFENLTPEEVDNILKYTTTTTE